MSFSPVLKLVAGAGVTLTPASGQGIVQIDVTGAGSGITQLTGDVVAGPGSGSQVATIQPAAVTYAKIQSVTNARVLGNVSGSAHAPMELTAADLSTLLGLASTYQPLLSLTNKDVLFATGTSTVGQDNAFSYDAATHKLTTALLTVSSSDGLGTAVALNQLADQGVIKTGGILAIGTSSAHALSLVTNGSLRLQISSAGAITLNSLTTNGLVKTSGGTGLLSIDTTTYLSTGVAASTYQPLLSLTATNVLFSGGGATVSQDNAFNYASGTHTLTATNIATNVVTVDTAVQGGAGSILVLRNAASPTTAIALAGANIQVTGDVVPTSTFTQNFGSATYPWNNVTTEYVTGGISGLNLNGSPTININAGIGGALSLDGAGGTVGGTGTTIGSASDRVGFFAAAPVARQTGGAATAGGSYTATEQGMINRMYSALRNYGLLT